MAEFIQMKVSTLEIVIKTDQMEKGQSAELLQHENLQT